jgi:hypothetical protein
MTVSPSRKTSRYDSTINLFQRQLGSGETVAAAFFYLLPPFAFKIRGFAAFPTTDMRYSMTY